MPQKTPTKAPKKIPGKIPEKLEEALEALEKVVEKLEEPELPLEDSLELFEEGTELSKICFSRLQEAEKKVEILVKKVPNPQSSEDFNAEEFDARGK